MSEQAHDTEETAGQIAMHLARKSLDRALLCLSVIGGAVTGIAFTIMLLLLQSLRVIDLPKNTVSLVAATVATLALLVSLYAGWTIEVRVKKILDIQRINLLNSK